MPTTTAKIHGTFGWNELMTTDPEGAQAFYGALLGWKFREMPMPEGEYAVATLDADCAGITTIPAGAKGMPPTWGSYVTVDDVDASAKRAVQLGGKVLVPTQEVPTVGRFCVIADPQGAMFSLITYAKQ
jgi:predicted enzyme related to lactoylglutathione lyase